jgi:hypothetical protein
MTYKEARDKYGTLDKFYKNLVLDKVSQKTDMHQGEVAEQAFVDSLQEVLKEKEHKEGLYRYLGYLHY